MAETSFSKRILFIADAGATHMIHWAKLLQQRGAHVSFLSFQPMKDLSFETIHLQPHFPQHFIKFIINAPRVRRVIESVQPDIVHTYYLTNYALMTALANPKTWVVTVAGSDLFLESSRSPLLRIISRQVLFRAGLVHSVAQHMSMQLLQIGVNPLRLVTLPEGIDGDIFHAPTSFRPQAPIIVSTRNHKPVYDVITLIRAIPIVLRQIPTASFVIMGDGEQRPILESLVFELGLQRNTRFLGHSDWPTLADNLRNAAVYVSTSLSDGTSASLFQAMHCGAFPVVTDIPANREWLTNGENGLLFPKSDSEALAKQILHVLANPDLQRNAVGRNFSLIEDKGIDHNIIVQLIDAYSRLLARA